MRTALWERLPKHCGRTSPDAWKTPLFTGFVHQTPQPDTSNDGH
jgi:hypothetical protein